MGQSETGATSKLMRRLWRALGSNRLAAFLLAALALASLLASLLPQMPAEPELQAAWLSAAELRYGWASGPLRALGLFDAYHAAWYLALLAALLLNTLACSLQRLPRLWRRLNRPPAVRRAPAFYQSFARRATWPLAGWQAGSTAAQRCLLRRRYKLYVEQDETTGVAQLYAERGRWTQAASLLSHLAVLLLLLAITARPALSWQQDDVLLLPDRPQGVGLDATLIAQSGPLTISRYPGGQPRSYAVDLALMSQGFPRLSRRVAINQPLTYQGISFHLQGYGPAVHLETPAGTLDLAFVGEEIQDVELPGTGLRLRLAYRPEGEPFYVQVLDQDGTSLGSGTVADGQEIVVQDTPISFTLTRYTLWQVSHDPTFGLALGAAGLLLAGTLLPLWLPYRRLWLWFDGQAGQMVGNGLSDGAFEALVAEITAGCSPEGGDG
jgi:cytochrome c biogenesis protein